MADVGWSCVSRGGEQPAPVIKNEIKIPKAQKQAAPVVNVENVVNVPEAQIEVVKETGTEVIEVLERDVNDKLKKLRKTKE